MKINLTHLARPLARPPKLSFAEAMLLPLHERATRYMKQMGLMSELTYSYQGGVSGNSTAAAPVFSNAGHSVMEVNLDFAAIAAARIAAGQAALGAGDILQLIGVSAGIKVHAVTLQVTTAEGAVSVCDVGDGADPNGFLAAADLNVVGWTSSLVTTPYSIAVGGGRLYTADDTIDFVVTTAATNVAVCRLAVEMSDLRSSR
jgi:hypothetical protein